MQPKPEIGRLRWLVTLATRAQTTAGTASLTEQLQNTQIIHADIWPLGTQTFVGAQQTDRPITHGARIRWLDQVDQQHVIIRNTYRRDGSVRTETFRVRRVGEDDGRKRFLRLDLELENNQVAPPT